MGLWIVSPVDAHSVQLALSDFVSFAMWRKSDSLTTYASSEGP